MKQTPLTRKTPLKSSSSLKRTGSLKTSSPLQRKTPLKTKSPGLKKSAPLNRAAPLNPSGNPSGKPRIRETGLVGLGRSPAHIAYHDKLVSLGCFACNHLGQAPSSKLCIHHVRGRRKARAGDNSEWLVICLCWLHHDPTTIEGGCMSSPSVHGNKRLFKAQIGTELWCVHESLRRAGQTPPWFTIEQWSEYLALDDQELATDWLVMFEKQTGAFLLTKSGS